MANRRKKVRSLKRELKVSRELLDQNFNDIGVRFNQIETAYKAPRDQASRALTRAVFSTIGESEVAVLAREVEFVVLADAAAAQIKTMRNIIEHHVHLGDFGNAPALVLMERIANDPLNLTGWSNSLVEETELSMDQLLNKLRDNDR